MVRKEKIYEYLKKIADTGHHEMGLENGVDSSRIAEAIGAERSNVSRDLNQLVREGRVVKLEGRPVLFIERKFYDRMQSNPLEEQVCVPEQICEGEENPLLNSAIEPESESFDHFIGSNGSLKYQIQQAKSAILYPPKGLHTLLTGPTGTGKSTFAEKLYEYAVHMHTIDSKARFVVFNCAEYAENPQLILSQLFGYQKGAFTGADREKKGLVEKAEGGILFLDEIHRLPPEGQELLFLLMDKGSYRRLGETEETRKANILIIGATTEDLNASLLQTFLRRMPVTIHLPGLEERYIEERLEMVELFFATEQRNMGVKVSVAREVLLALLLYECKGNIGQLKADVQLVCARGFLDYKANKEEQVRIDLAILPDYIRRGMLRSNQKNDLIDFIKNMEEYVIFSSEPEPIRQNNFYHKVSKRYQLYQKEGRSNQEISGLLKEELNSYMDQLFQKYHIAPCKDGRERLLQIVDQRIYDAVEDAIKFVEMKQGQAFGERIRIGLIMHVNSLVERIHQGVSISYQVDTELILHHPNEWKSAKYMMKLLEEELDIEIPRQELIFLTMILCESSQQEKYPRIGLLVLAHGNATASSMCEVANALMGVQHCQAIDMPVEDSIQQVYEKAVKLADEIDEGAGILLLVDMGSLEMLGSMLSQRHSVETVTMVSTLVVVEALRKCMMRGVNLKEAAEEIRGISMQQGYVPEAYQNREQRTIVATCVSGAGTAIKIGQMLKEALSLEEKESIHIAYRNMRSKGEIQEEKFEGEVIAVVGTIDLNLPGVPYISVDELILGEGISYLEHLLQYNLPVNQIQKQENILDKRALTGTLKELLSFLDAKKTGDCVFESCEKITRELSFAFTKEVMIRYVIHTACMIERIIKQDVLPYRDAENMIQHNQVLYHAIKQALICVEEFFCIQIPDTEIAYLIDMLEEEWKENTISV